MKQLEEIKARASAATAGPWKALRGGDFQNVRLHDGSLWIDVVDGSGQVPPHGEWIDSPDIDFIAAARTDVPRLVAALEAVWVLADEHDAECQRIGDISWVPPGRIRAAITEALEAE